MKYSGIPSLKTEGTPVSYDDPIEVLKAAIAACEKVSARNRNKRLKNQCAVALKIAINEIEPLRVRAERLSEEVRLLRRQDWDAYKAFLQRHGETMP